MDGGLPVNVRIGPQSLITGEAAFRRFMSLRDPALVIGHSSTLDGVQFAIGIDGMIEIGNCCYLSNAVLLAEIALKIGSYVMIGWNTTIADTDFHPLDPRQRLSDAIACSPLNPGTRRPSIPTAPVVIEDDVYIGPGVSIMKGVHIGKGALIEPGSVVTRDVSPRARVLGNPARVIGEV